MPSRTSPNQWQCTQTSFQDCKDKSRHETEIGTGRTDQELTGYAIGYSMGGMSIKAQRNEADESVTSGTTANEYKRTEILVGFAF